MERGEKNLLDVESRKLKTRYLSREVEITVTNVIGGKT
jgi:hypothetical protein